MCLCRCRHHRSTNRFPLNKVLFNHRCCTHSQVLHPSLRLLQTLPSLNTLIYHSRCNSNWHRSRYSNRLVISIWLPARLQVRVAWIWIRLRGCTSEAPRLKQTKSPNPWSIATLCSQSQARTHKQAEAPSRPTPTAIVSCSRSSILSSGRS